VDQEETVRVMGRTGGAVCTVKYAGDGPATACLALGLPARRWGHAETRRPVSSDRRAGILANSPPHASASTVQRPGISPECAAACGWPRSPPCRGSSMICRQVSCSLQGFLEQGAAANPPHHHPHRGLS